VSGPLKVAWGLVGFVIVLGLVLWVITGRPVFAVFVVLGVVTGVGAWVTGRAERQSKKEIP
jgi:dolichol kinase